MPTGVEGPTEIVKLDEPAPGAAIDAGVKLAVAPTGKPAAESAIDELKFPESVDVIVAVPAPPRAIVKAVGAAAIEKFGLKRMSIMGCSSMPLGASPSCPSR